ncbi:peptidase M24, structural domain-containing protein [Mycena leptocephala]|nr:peptidase M24, structural domain-containing protein [Mycena leptocephala]
MPVKFIAYLLQCEVIAAKTQPLSCECLRRALLCISIALSVLGLSSFLLHQPTGFLMTGLWRMVTCFCISPHFTGHGIGTIFHRKPWIIHDLNDEPDIMGPGHCFTIEPCIIEGKTPTCWIFPDGWTASTEDCARSAQAEHMVLITESGYEVLTR